MKDLSNRRRGLVVGIAVVTAVFGMAAAGHAEEDDGVVPDSCKLHPRHVVNPGCVPALESEVVGPTAGLPNVVPDVQSVAVYRTFVPGPDPNTFVEGDLVLGFDGWVQNLGEAPLEILADDPDNPSTAEQCTSWTLSYLCEDRHEVGEYAWHEPHSHYHFQDFADYQLRRLGLDGRPDYSDAGLLARSEKVSFCLVDSTLVDTLDPAPPLFLTCGPDRQGVSPGWADIYDVGTPGQELPIEGLPDGRYALVVSMDHPNRIAETDDTDNTLEVIVELSGNGTEAAIVDKRLS
jgi:hypothetical protein